MSSDEEDFPIKFSKEIHNVGKLIDTVEVVKRHNGENLLFVGVGSTLSVFDFEGNNLHVESKHSEGYVQEIRFFEELQCVIFVSGKSFIFCMSMEESNEFSTSKEPVSSFQCEGDYYQMTSKYFNFFIFIPTTDHMCLCKLDVQTRKTRKTKNLFEHSIVCLVGIPERKLVCVGGSFGYIALEDNGVGFTEIYRCSGQDICSISYESKNQNFFLGTSDGHILILSENEKKTKKMKSVYALLQHEVHMTLSFSSDLKSFVVGSSYLDPLVVVFSLDQFKERKEELNTQINEDLTKPICRHERHEQYINSMVWVSSKKKYFVTCGYNGRINLFENLAYVKDLDIFKDLDQRIQYIWNSFEKEIFKDYIFNINIVTQVDVLTTFKILLVSWKQ